MGSLCKANLLKLPFISPACRWSSKELQGPSAVGFLRGLRAWGCGLWIAWGFGFEVLVSEAISLSRAGVG